MINIEIETKDKDTFLKLPNIPDVSLPPVTIVTPTLNRSKEFEIAVRNWKNITYPRNKLYWVIIDDSDEEQHTLLYEYLHNELKEEFINNKINYIHINNDGKKLTIGKKRNLCAENTKTDIICHMDDDDYYYPDSVKIRVTSLYYHKRPVCGCMSYNCYNLVDDSQFIACGKEELMNTGEAALCYLKSYWKENKFNDDDTYEESVNFLQGNSSKFINIPCLWILLSITHGKNTSGRKNNQDVLDFSFLELLPVSDFEFIKKQKLNLMLSYPFNKECMEISKKIKASNFPEKLIDKLSIKHRKNVIIREILNSIPSKSTCSDIDFIVICFPAQYIRNLKFEEETELIEFIKDNKTNYRFTIYTDCEKGYTYQGITLSPYWKWRSCNKYNKCLIMYDPSHLKLNINSNSKYFINKYNFSLPEINYATNKFNTFEEFEQYII